MRDVHVTGGQLDVTGHLNSNTTVEGGNMNPIKVEITNQPSPPYVPSLGGTYRYEAKPGLILLKDVTTQLVQFVLPTDYLNRCVVRVDNQTVTINDPHLDISHTLFCSPTDRFISLEGFLDVWAAANSGECLGSAELITHPKTEEDDRV